MADKVVDQKKSSGYSITEQKPGIVSFEQFDVFDGKGGLSREQYKESTFHNAGQMDGDAKFHDIANLLQSDGNYLLDEEKPGETTTESKEEKAIEE